MKRTLTAYITKSFSFFARARAHDLKKSWVAAKFLFVAAWAMTSSTGLIFCADAVDESFGRWRKIQKLQRLPASEVETILIAALQSDPSSVVRQGAAQSLGNYSQNSVVVRALAKALHEDPEKSVRCACALSLGLSPTFKAIRALENAVDDPDPDLRRQIAFSLKRHRVGANKLKAEALLKKLGKDSDLSVRLMAGAEK
ncbi:MAG: hypothetical protein KCHDKBKB_02381 [Elusimicrobia bacterium]|nr:hypothetical protein [Elusimicrobiota bacterium]